MSFWHTGDSEPRPPADFAGRKREALVSFAYRLDQCEQRLGMVFSAIDVRSEQLLALARNVISWAEHCAVDDRDLDKASAFLSSWHSALEELEDLTDHARTQAYDRWRAGDPSVKESEINEPWGLETREPMDEELDD